MYLAPGWYFFKHIQWNWSINFHFLITKKKFLHFFWIHSIITLLVLCLLVDIFMNACNVILGWGKGSDIIIARIKQPKNVLQLELGIQKTSQSSNLSPLKMCQTYILSPQNCVAFKMFRHQNATKLKLGVQKTSQSSNLLT